jgi:protein involved in sex pheromone biosynthesis
VKTKPLAISLLTIALVSACSDAKRDAEKAKEDASAKARADAAKKEMETLPKAFSTPDYYKKNEPAKTATPPAAETPAPKK